MGGPLVIEAGRCPIPRKHRYPIRSHAVPPPGRLMHYLPVKTYRCRCSAWHLSYGDGAHGRRRRR